MNKIDKWAVGGKAFYSSPTPRLGKVYKLTFERPGPFWGDKALMLWTYGPRDGINNGIYLHEEDISRLIDYLVAIQYKLGTPTGKELVDPPFPFRPD